MMNRLPFRKVEEVGQLDGGHLDEENIFGGLLAFLEAQHDNGTISSDDYENSYLIIGRVIRNAGDPKLWTEKELRARATDRQSMVELRRFIVEQYPSLKEELDVLYHQFMADTAQKNNRG